MKIEVHYQASDVQLKTVDCVLKDSYPIVYALSDHSMLYIEEFKQIHVFSEYAIYQRTIPKNIFLVKSNDTQKQSRM